MLKKLFLVALMAAAPAALFVVELDDPDLRYPLVGESRESSPPPYPRVLRQLYRCSQAV